jgi:glycosyltransferase involved in cell wall biosynthesis
VLKVSVIVPVYNPGHNIDDCIESLLGQSLDPSEYEIVFVDDGSTDETPARLDELSAQHPNVCVEHIPNSGWPGRPRNLGMDLARGEYVYFVDNDDWLGTEALERLHAAALANEADIVVGKVVGHHKPVPRTLFRRNVEDAKLDWPPLLRMLTPHKLFRKALLVEHGIRFPEGRRRLEDHVFVVHAFFHAGRISVLADYPCYHWILRDKDMNASWQQLDPIGYYQNVREVLDVVEEHTEPGDLRDQMFVHWYRSKMLPRVGGGPFVRREPEYRRRLYEEVRKLALERYGPEVNDRLPFNMRTRSALLRDGRYESLIALAEFESQFRAEVTVRELRREGGEMAVRLEAQFLGKDEPLAFVRRGTRMLWAPPQPLRDDLSEEHLDVTDELAKSRVEVVLRSKRDRSEYVLRSRSERVFVRADAGGDAKRPILIADAELDPGTAAAGSKLPAGDWELRALIHVLGFHAAGTAIVPAPERRLIVLPLRRRADSPLVVTITRNGRLQEAAPPRRRRVARRLRRLPRKFRRAWAAGGAAGAT